MKWKTLEADGCTWQVRAVSRPAGQAEVPRRAGVTRREELLLTNDALRVSHLLRRQLADSPATDAMDKLLAFMKRTKTNEELIDRVLQNGS